MPEGRENDVELLHCIRASVWEDDEVLELEGCDGCTTLCVYLLLLT